MPANARLIVLMEENEKAALEAQAEAANISTAEFVRRQLFRRDAPEAQAFLQILADLKPLVRRASKAIDANLAEIRALRKAGEAADARAVQRAQHALTHEELGSIADRLQLSSEPAVPVRRRGTRS